MADRQLHKTVSEPTTQSPEEGASTDDTIGHPEQNELDRSPASDQGGAAPPIISHELDTRLDQLITMKLQQLRGKSATRDNAQHFISDSESDADSERSAVNTLRTVLNKNAKKKKSKKSKKKRKKKDSSSSDTDISEGDKYMRDCERKKKKKKKKTKKSRSSSSDSSESSFPSTDSDEQAFGVMERKLAKTGKHKRDKEPKASVRVRSVLREALDVRFDTFKPLEVISQAREKYSGIKGVKDSFLKEMDFNVVLNDQMKRFETAMFTMQSAVLSAMAAIVPVANRMSLEGRFTSLVDGMSDGLGVLAAASSFANFKRYENVYKHVTTEAGKEVTRSKKVKDKTGKEFTLFLPPKPIKGKTWDSKLMYGGQLQYYLKRVELTSKQGKQMGLRAAPADYQPSHKRPRYDQPRKFQRGRSTGFQSSAGYRPRSQRGQSGWHGQNSYNQGPQQQPQGGAQGFYRGGNK